MEPKEKAILVLGVILTVIGVLIANYMRILDYLLELGILKIGVGNPIFVVMVLVGGPIIAIVGLALIVFSLASLKEKKVMLVLGVILCVVGVLQMFYPSGWNSLLMTGVMLMAGVMLIVFSLGAEEEKQG